MVARACGCLQEFQHYTVDKYREQRKAKFQKTRCPVCVAKLVEEQRIAATLPKKGEAFKSLPTGAQISMVRRADNTWTGTLIADGTTVEAVGEGPQGVTLALARNWLLARGAGKATPAAATPAPAAAAKPAATAATPVKPTAVAAAPKPAPAPKAAPSKAKPV